MLQYSDSANLNTFELFDLSQEENAIALENIIDEFPENTTGFSNLEMPKTWILSSKRFFKVFC